MERYSVSTTSQGHARAAVVSWWCQGFAKPETEAGHDTLFRKILVRGQKVAAARAQFSVSLVHSLTSSAGGVEVEQ